MDKNRKVKTGLIESVLDLANAKLTDLSSGECVKLAREIHKHGDVVWDALINPDEHSGGARTRGRLFDIEGKEKEYLTQIREEIWPRINGMVQGNYLEESLGDVNFSLMRLDDGWSFVRTPEGPPRGMSADLWRILVGLAWALHGRPADCIKRCTRCENLILQRRRRPKQYCGNCIQAAAEDKRRGTPERKEQLRLAAAKHFREVKKGLPPLSSYAKAKKKGG